MPVYGLNDINKDNDQGKKKQSSKNNQNNGMGSGQHINRFPQNQFAPNSNKVQKGKFNGNKNILSVNFQDKNTYEHIQTKKILFVSTLKNHQFKTPRKQNYWNMLSNTCCPVFTLLSLTFILLLIYLGVFVAQCIVGINQQGSLLQISTQTAKLMGANVPDQIRQGNVWRVISAAVLHGDFMHYLGNSLATIILISRVQHTLGSLRLLGLYITAAIGANFFSALISYDTIKLGASTCIYAGLGFCVGYLIINWKVLGQISETMRCSILFQILFYLVFGIVFTSLDANIDYYGHIGGFVVGLFGSSLCKRISEQKDCSLIVRRIFGGLLVIFIILVIVLFYTVHE